MKPIKRLLSCLVLLGACGVSAFAVDIFTMKDAGGTVRFSLGDTGNALFTSNDAVGPALKVIQNGLGKIFALFDGGTEVVTVLDGGNVGVGVSNPTGAGRLQVAGTITSSTGGLKFPDATIQTTKSPVHVGPVYRWCTFSSYDQPAGWFDGNNTRYFGGYNPSTWGDGNANVTSLSSNKDILRTLFTQKGYGGKNAVVYNKNWYMYSSTDTHDCLVLFRILNTTGAAINWSVWWNTTSCSGWGNWAYAMINGSQVDGVADMYAASGPRNINISVPAGPTRVSTVVFQSSGANPSGCYRSTFLAFTNDCLVLPVGLQYVDDLDTATGDWTQ